MTSDASSDHSSFSERFAPFIYLDTVINLLHTLACVCEKSSYFLFAKVVVNLAYDLLGNLDDTSTVALTRKWKVLIVSGPVYNRLGEDHPHVATSYDNLALVYNSLGEYNQAKQLHEKALTIRKKIFGEDHVSVAGSRS